MSTLSELQKKLQQESQGIMFPFSAATNAVNTTQQVYDSSTDGIMTMTGKKYIGPDAVIQYGTEEQGFPRQLKQIEAPMLPQVSNLPPQGTGIMELAPGASTPEPISTDPVVEQPAVDPCPPGYQLVNGVCQLIQQQGGSGKTPESPEITNGIIVGRGYKGLEDNIDLRKGTFYNTLSDSEKADYNKAISFGRGIQYKTLEDGTKKIIAKSPTFSQALKEISPYVSLIEAAEKFFGNMFNPKEPVTVTTGGSVTATTTETFGNLNTGNITIEDMEPLPIEENKTTRKIPNILNKIQSIKNSYLSETDSIRKEQKKIQYNQTLENANDVFQLSVEATKNKPLSEGQKQYLNSDDRKAISGESKDNDGNLDNRPGKVQGRENAGYGFRATSANYQKATKTFDHRFK
tara:strand:- start:240 stop:1451 length:1212 start_codon:yes stop_codon:yes gene_type:complete